MIGNKKTRSKQVDALKLRMLMVKPLITMDYLSLYQYEFGKINKEESIRICNVWYLRTADEEIVSRFELIAEKLKNK